MRITIPFHIPSFPVITIHFSNGILIPQTKRDHSVKSLNTDR
jgi:hypothetical protein